MVRLNRMSNNMIFILPVVLFKNRVQDGTVHIFTGMTHVRRRDDFHREGSDSVPVIFVYGCSDSGQRDFCSPQYWKYAAQNFIVNPSFRRIYTFCAQGCIPPGLRIANGKYTAFHII